MAVYIVVVVVVVVATQRYVYSVVNKRNWYGHYPATGTLPGVPAKAKAR